MRLRLPPQTRVILVPSDERPSREYLLGRGLLLFLLAVTAVLAVLIVVVLVSYGSLTRQAWRAQVLEGELAATRGALSRTAELQRELDEQRGFQERLLVMLGVEPAPALDSDTLSWSGERASPRSLSGTKVAGGPAPSLAQTAAIVMTPPPDMWPLRGFVTREFERGDTPRGVLPHPGIDLVAPTGTPVLSAGRGVVVRADWDDYLGNYVEIRHGFSYVTVYGHCNSLSVRPGDRVDRGQHIATLGGTGQASAPHLHFEVWKGDREVDPRSVISGDPES